jgi:hypothetical protein
LNKKNYLSLLFLLTSSLSVCGQIIQFHGDTAVIDNKNYCLIHTSGGVQKHFSICAIATGEEVLLASPKSDNPKNMVYDIMFLPTAQNSSWRPTRDATDYRMAFVKQLYLSSVLTPTGIDDWGAKHYMDNAGEVDRIADAMAARPKDGRRVKRNTSEDVFITRDQQIKQDKVLVGVYQDADFMTAKGTRLHGYRIALPDGTIIAEASTPDIYSHECVIVTKHDNHEYLIVAKNLKFALWDIVTYLIDNDYL